MDALLVVLFALGSAVVLLVGGSLAGLVLVPTLDLVLRPIHVPRWADLPLLGAMPILLGVPLALVDGPLRYSQIENVLFILIAFHFALAGICMALGTGLALTRGLRPGGDTLRRRRTTVVAALLLACIGTLPLVTGLIDDDLPVVFGWIAVGAGCGLIWLLVLNRHGPPRLNQGKRATATLFLLGLFHLCVCMALFGQAVANEGGPPDELPVVLGLFSVVLSVLPWGLRYLSGPLPAGPFLVHGLSACTLLASPVMHAVWTPVHVGFELPVWRDLAGQPGPPRRIDRYSTCVWILGATEHCTIKSGVFAAPGRMPLHLVPPDMEPLILDGKRTASGDWAYGTPIEVRELDGKAILPGRPRPLALGPELHAALKELEALERPLEVERSPAWTVQDLTSICASYRWSCRTGARTR